MLLKNIFHSGRRTIAKFWLRFFPDITIIGVTGSYGKTSTVRAITAVLSQKYKVLTTDINLDTLYNLPITLLKLRPGYQKLVLEYGVDHKNEMDYHLSLVKPQIAVLTGINPTHSDEELLGSLEGIIKEKTKLLDALPERGLVILNYDDVKVREIGEGLKNKKIFYSIKTPTDFWADEIEVSFEGTSFTLRHPEGKIKMKTGLIGVHFVQDALAAIIIGREQGLTWEEVEKGISTLKPLSGRVSIEKGPMETILINDSLRANPASTLAGLRLLSELPTQGRKIATLGEMGELGSKANESHLAIGKEVANLKIDYLVAIGPLMKLAADEAIKNGMDKQKVYWVNNVQEAADILRQILKKGDLFYLKGSLLKHLERVRLLLDDQKVNCTVISCHRYNPCPSCPSLNK